MATHEGYLNFIGDNKSGGGKGGFIKGLDGWVRFSKKLNLEGVEKGCKVKVQYKDTDNGQLVTRIKVTGAPSARRGGGGNRNNPATQRSIVMQHSQEMALRALELICAQGAVKLGAANKPDARRAALDLLLDELTAKFYLQAAEEGPQEFIEELEDEEDIEVDDDDEFDEDDDADEDEDDEDDDEESDWDEE